MRIPFVAGNWKMFTTAARAAQLATEIVRGLDASLGVEVAVCPPFPYLVRVAEALRGSPIALGGQNLYPEQEGAYTGEVSPAMLLDAGCRYVILGHSERRQKLSEDNAFINKKVHVALDSGLAVILCLGETLDEREAGWTQGVLESQLVQGLDGISAALLARLVLAYEPVWAIGTGRNATPAQAQESHAYLRRRLTGLYGLEDAQSVRIQYGGSVKPDNAAELMRQPDVDGALVGGASLNADSFLAIVRAAQPSG